MSQPYSNNAEVSQLNVVLGEMIPMMRAAYSLPALSKEELREVVTAWRTVLLNVVPAIRVKEMFMLAMQQPVNLSAASVLKPRAVSAPELIVLWQKVCAEQRDKVQFNDNKVCKACDGKKEIVAYSPKLQCDITVRCPFHVTTQSEEEHF
jgi:hypothetical protein